MAENTNGWDKETQRSVERFVAQAAHKLADKLNQEISRGHENIAFLIAFGLATLNDLLLDPLADLLGLPSFGTGWVVLKIISVFLNLFLTFFLFRKGWFLTYRLRVMWWVLGFFVDDLPAFDLLPLNMLLVGYAWKLVKARSLKAERKLQHLNKLKQKEVEKILDDISVLDEETEEEMDLIDRRRIQPQEADQPEEEEGEGGGEGKPSGEFPGVDEIKESMEKVPEIEDLKHPGENQYQKDENVILDKNEVDLRKAA